MPTVGPPSGRYQFRVRPRENYFERPHVHVVFGRRVVCRIALDDNTFMDPPPPGTEHAIMKQYNGLAEKIREEWIRTRQG